MKQRRSEHGGSFAKGKRRARRPLNAKNPVHLVLKSERAIGRRNLKQNRPIVLRTLIKYSKRFGVKIHEKAICGNHIHCVVKAPNRFALQNFFRVVAGQIAQEILKSHPMAENEFTTNTKLDDILNNSHPKNRRSFWTSLAYTRIVRWGFDFRNVINYVVRNTLETERIISYKARRQFVGTLADTYSVKTPKDLFLIFSIGDHGRTVGVQTN